MQQEPLDLDRLAVVTENPDLADQITKAHNQEEQADGMLDEKPM